MRMATLTTTSSRPRTTNTRIDCPCLAISVDVSVTTIMRTRKFIWSPEMPIVFAFPVEQVRAFMTGVRMTLDYNKVLHAPDQEDRGIAINPYPSHLEWRRAVHTNPVWVCEATIQSADEDGDEEYLFCQVEIDDLETAIGLV
jgi:hypothetical protein